jgi:integrase
LLDKLRRGIDPRLEQKRQIKQKEEEWGKDEKIQKLVFKTVLEDYISRKSLKPGTILNYRYVALSFITDGQVRFTPHDLRRTYLTQGYLLGHDMKQLKRLANHKIKNLRDVTEGYLVVQVHDMREPMEKVSSRLWELMTSPVETYLDYPDQLGRANSNGPSGRWSVTTSFEPDDGLSAHN